MARQQHTVDRGKLVDLLQWHLKQRLRDTSTSVRDETVHPPEVTDDLVHDLVDLLGVGDLDLVGFRLDVVLLGQLLCVSDCGIVRVVPKCNVSCCK